MDAATSQLFELAFFRHRHGVLIPWKISTILKLELRHCGMVCAECSAWSDKFR
jgi:hypothetical protein